MTLNNIFSYLQTMGDSHKQLKKTIINDRDEWLSNGDVDYPSMFLELKSAKTSRDNRSTIYTFVCMIADLSNVAAFAQENQQEVQSDLTQIAEDILSLLQYESDKNSDFKASREINIEYLTDQLEDIGNAIGFEFSIATKYASNRCQVPTNFISPNAPTSPYIMANYSFRNDAPKYSFTIEALKNKQILYLSIDAESPLKVNSKPNIDEFYYNQSIGEFIFGKELQEGQIIQILNRSI
jgi:hypothetical protein